MPTQNRWVLLAAAWCAALNLRGISIAVSPVLPIIKADLALSYAEAGFLFAVPTVMMAVFGLPGGLLADTIGMKKTITLGLVLLLAGSALRATSSGFMGLVIWTALFGAGMGIANPGLTRMVRDRFPDLPGTATGIFTSGFVVGAIAGSWLTYPYVTQWTGSWRGMFLAWSGLVLLALVGWLVLAPERKSAGRVPLNISELWRDKTVWKLSIIFLMMNVTFYAVASWIPTYYHELGVKLDAASMFLTLFLIVSLPSSLFVPLLSDRFGGRRASVIVSCLASLPAILGVIFFPLAAPSLYAVVMGLTSGGVFALSFALPLDYVEPRRVGSVAGMNLLVGYGGAFFGPYSMGLLHDWTGSFAAGWSVAIVSTVLLTVTAWSLPKRVY